MKDFIIKLLIIIAAGGLFTYGLYSAAEGEKKVQQQIEDAIDEHFRTIDISR